MEWYRRNPEKRKIHAATFRAAHPDKVLAAKKRYRARHPDRVRVGAARHYAANLARYAKWRRDNKERTRQLRAEWVKRKPEAVRALDQNRRARRAGAPGRGIRAAEYREVLAASCGLCNYCGKPSSLTLDHIEPLSKGGAHDTENAAAACVSCNSSKHDAPLLLFLARRAQQQSRWKAA